MTERLKNKVAVITGGCSGMGLGTVELFLAEGARVVVADILADNGKTLEKRFPGQSERVAELLLDSVSHLQPLQRIGSPNDIAEACLYLASEASAFVTGTELRVDGGATLIPPLELNPEKPGSLGYMIAEAVQKVSQSV